jgi:predicted dehydrogenase
MAALLSEGVMMNRIDVAIVGTGWCGGIRTEACAANPLVSAIHIAETNSARLAEMAAKVGASSASADYRDLLDKKQISAVFVCATPETTHFPIARDFLRAGKHVFLEKPIALELDEADELISIARSNGLKFTIGYSQRFNPKFAYVKQCVSDGTIGKPVSVLVSRHISRSLGKKISGRVKLSPAAMESTHDLDFVLWCLEPAKPVRVYSQVNYGAMREASGNDIPDLQWITVTMDSGLSFVVGGGWSLPPGYPNFSSTWIELVGTEGALMVDDTHRDVMLNTVKGGAVFPLSTMPGESVGHVYAGPMASETVHFVEAVALDRPVLVTPEQARQVMELYIAADLSAELNEPVTLPLANKRPAGLVANR